MRSEPAFDDFYVATRTRLLRQLTVMLRVPWRRKTRCRRPMRRPGAGGRGSRDSTTLRPGSVPWLGGWPVSRRRRSAVAARLLPSLHRPGDGGGGETVEEALDLERAVQAMRPEHRRVHVLHEMVGQSVSRSRRSPPRPESLSAPSRAGCRAAGQILRGCSDPATCLHRLSTWRKEGRTMPDLPNLNRAFDEIADHADAARLPDPAALRRSSDRRRNRSRATVAAACSVWVIAAAFALASQGGAPTPCRRFTNRASTARPGSPPPP